MARTPLTSRVSSDPHRCEAVLPEAERKYSFGGVTIESCIPLLVTPSQERHFDARVDWGRAPDSLPTIQAKCPQWEVTDGRFLLRIPGLARYLVSEGREIIIDPEAGAPEGAIRNHLMSTAIAALFHQRGLLPLHVSAISHGRGSVVFCGPSGAGKSTMAAFLCHKYGHTLMGDDVCVVDREDSTFRVFPCAPYIRVWLDTVNALGLDPDSFPKDIVRRKYHLPMGDQFGDQPLPLKRVYVLREAGVGERISITPLKGMRAAQVLVDNTFRARQLKAMGLTSSHMQTCAALARQVQVFELRRPAGFEFMDQAIVMLERHLDEGDEAV